MRCIRNKFWQDIDLNPCKRCCSTDDFPLGYCYSLLVVAEFFELLGVENSVKLLICLLLEHQILVFSSDTQVSRLID